MPYSDYTREEMQIRNCPDAAGAHTNEIKELPSETSPLDTELARAEDTAASALASARNLRAHLHSVLREPGPQVEEGMEREPAACNFAERIREINSHSWETLQVIADIRDRLQL